jgi:hypothetical protein
MTAAAMVKAADVLCNARGGHNTTVTAAMTQQSRRPAPNNRKKCDKRVVTPAPKVALLPTLTFIPFKTLARACVNFIIITSTSLTGVLHPVLGWKTACRQTTVSSVANPTHATATAMRFPANAGLIFLTDELTNDRYRVELMLLTIICRII